MTTDYSDRDIQISFLEALSQSQEDFQRDMVIIRQYMDGDHGVPLTDRLREWLGNEGTILTAFRLNLVRAIVEAVSDRLRIARVDTEDSVQVEWLSLILKENRVALWESDLYEDALSDGVAFILLDWDLEAEIPLIVPHPHYTDMAVGGNGYGIEMGYENNDPSQRPTHAIKYWVEYPKGGPIKHRRNIYWPERIERQELDKGSRWSTFETVDWTADDGRALGVPVIDFRNKRMRSEVADAIAVQNAINKVGLDLMSSSDMAAFRIYYAIGFMPTTDGKEPAEDGSNLLKLEPGKIVGTTKPPRDAEFGAVEPSDPEAQIKTLKELINWMSIVSKTPVEYLLNKSDELTGPMLAKVETRQKLFQEAWIETFEKARVLSNAFSDTNFDEDHEISLLWKNVEIKSEMNQIETLILKREISVPFPQLWREAGYSESQIETMMDSEEYQRMLLLLGPGENEEPEDRNE